MFARVAVPRFCQRATICIHSYATRGFHASLKLNEKTIKVLPTQVVVAAFTKSDAADAAAEALWDSGVLCSNIAVVRKNEDSKVKITESGKIGKLHGASVGSLLAGASVLLLGPTTIAAGAVGGALAGATTAGMGAATGAAIGALAGAEGTMLANVIASLSGGIAGSLAASEIETLSPEKMDKLGNILQPSQSALVAVFDQVVVPMDQLDAEKQARRDEVFTMLGTDIGNTLRNGEDIAIMVAASDDDEEMVVTRMAVGSEAADISLLVITGDAADRDDGEPEDEITYEVQDGQVLLGDGKKGEVENST